MRARFQQGEVDAGSLKLAFGRNPVGYMNKHGIRSDEDAGDSPVINFGGPALSGAIAFYEICFADKGVKARSGRIVKR
jgi:hypothetical protein